MKLYQNKLLEVYNLGIKGMKGNTNILTLTYNKDPNYVPSENERAIYFVV